MVEREGFSTPYGTAEIGTLFPDTVFPVIGRELTSVGRLTVAVQSTLPSAVIVVEL